MENMYALNNLDHEEVIDHTDHTDHTDRTDHTDHSSDVCYLEHGSYYRCD